MIFMKISQNFYQISLKIVVNLTDFSPHVCYAKKIKFDTFSYFQHFQVHKLLVNPGQHANSED